MSDADRPAAPLLVFVGGAPRSGTTLTQRVLNAHPMIYGGPEFDFTPEIAALRRRMIESVRSGRIAPHADEATVNAAVAGMLRAIFDARAARAGAGVFSEKTPANVLEFMSLGEMFPEARFIFVLRDPRAVAASMMRVLRKSLAQGKRPPSFAPSLVGAGESIARYWAAGFAAADAMPERVLTLHYEDLVAEPEATARRMCDFLGLPWDDLMIRPEETPAGEFQSALGDDIYYTRDEIARPIAKADPEGWRRDLTQAQAEVVTSCIAPHPMLERYGLPERPSPRAQAILRAHRLRQGLRSAGRRAARLIGV